MKKFLLPFFAFAMVSSMTAPAFAAEGDPTFPESFNITINPQGPKVTQGEDMGVYTIKVEGLAPAQNITLTVDVPAGWDGLIGMTDVDQGNPDIAPLINKAKAAEDLEWVPIDAMLQYGMKKGNTLTFPVDGEEHRGQFYLFKGDLVETTNQIALEVTVEEGTPAAEEPTVPSTFTVTASSAGVKIGTVEELFEMYALLFEDRDDMAYSFGVKGKTAGDTETVTVEVPEGWDGYIYGITNLSEIMPFSGRKAKAIDWVTIKEYDPEGNMTKGNQVAIPADGKIYMASLYLYKGDKLAANEAVSFMAQIEKDVNSGIAGIEAAETEVRYFNLQGVEVKNPENGVYLKVSNGKVSKVAVK